MLKNKIQFDTYLTFFPLFSLAIIIGQAAISLVFFSIFIIFIYKFNKIKFFEKKEDFFLIFFFLIIIFSSFINTEPESKSYKSVISSLLYLKFLFFYYLIRQIKFDDYFYKNLKFFFFVSAIIFMFVLLDTTYQYFEPNRLDIFGYKALLDNANRLTGPFGDNESIPGAYLTKICFVNLIFLNFYLTYFFLEKKKNYLIFFLIILNVSYLCVILITGERISFLMSILSFLLFFILINKSKLFFLLSGLVTFILFVIIINNNHYLKSRYEILLKFVIAKDYVSIDTAKISEKDLKKRNPINFLNNQWGAHYLTAIEIFKEKPLIGSGIKGFRMQCGKKEYEDIRSLSFYKRCSTHPHNIYFELLSETGFLGFSSIIIFFLILIYKNFRDILILKKIKFQKNDQILFACYVSSFAIFLAILWPIRSSGSFFSNLNGTMIWFNIYWIILFQSYFKRNNMI